MRYPLRPVSRERKRIESSRSTGRCKVHVPLSRLLAIETFHTDSLRLLSSILPISTFATWAEVALVTIDLYSHRSLIAHSSTNALHSLKMDSSAVVP